MKNTFYYVYILKSLSDGTLYIGCTNNWNKRLGNHNAGLVKSTKHKLPLALIYFEAYRDKSKAFNRERSLKTEYTLKRRLLSRI